MIDKFSSSDIAVDDRHTPKLYARFLATLLSKYRRNIPREKAVGDLQTVPTKNTDVLTYVGGEMSDDCGNYQQPQIIQDRNYDSSGRQWPQFGDGMEFLYVTHEGENTGSEEPSSQGGMSEDEVLALMQGLNHPEWFGGMLMPRYVFSGFAAYTRHYLTGFGI